MKYNYGDMSLIDYCKKNNINYDTIYHRIKNYEKKYKLLSIDEIINKAMYNTNDLRIKKFYYNGQTLLEYCQNNNLVYDTIWHRIKGLLKKKPDITEEELLDRAINNRLLGNSRYIYNNEPLSKYCKDNNINKGTIIFRINNLRKVFPNTADDILTKWAIECYTEKKEEKVRDYSYLIKYYYKGQSLKEYCKDNNIDYLTITGRIYRIKKENPLIDDSELVNLAINKCNNKIYKYYYNGRPLFKYCEENKNISYLAVLQYLYIRKKSTNLSDEEIIKEYIDKKNLYSDTFISNKYFYNNKALNRYCEENHINYQSIMRYIYYNRKKGTFLNDEEIIDYAIKKHFKNKKIKEINYTFENINNNVVDLDKVCKILNINKDEVEKLHENNFTYKSSINLLWYYPNITLQEARKLKENINDEEFLKKLDLYNLFIIYKCDLMDIRYLILQKQKKYLYNKINSICQNKNLKNSIIEELKNELELCILNVIEKNNSNNKGQFITHLDKAVTGNVHRYLKRYTFDSLNSLDDNIDDSKRSYHEIVGESDHKELDEFNDNILKYLSDLDKDELKFIILKYQERYTNEELSRKFKLSIEEVNIKESYILNKLRNNQNIIKLKKSLTNKG